MRATANEYFFKILISFAAESAVTTSAGVEELPLSESVGEWLELDGDRFTKGDVPDDGFPTKGDEIDEPKGNEIDDGSDVVIVH